ncbi:1,4-alpha-glucan-branching enzyme 1, chloroplastic/amyloplastic-like [Prosopis cineraria]|uniref:1,4-alpha-glucan-branching enzyme 1, chloroplastic/amyloplastic-like n=1 Tax=Prosopis cineraria TaxID=364024 RepID=UPI00241012FB|nr:1,4-alpha-glucan-branching enzyme 1, chloroplastic/amyloplastic-like [Prosopis cineraria]
MAIKSTMSLSFSLKKHAFSRFALAEKFRHDSDYTSSSVAESDKALVPGIHHNASYLTDQHKTPNITSDVPQALQSLEDLAMEEENSFKNDEAAATAYWLQRS